MPERIECFEPVFRELGKMLDDVLNLLINVLGKLPPEIQEKIQQEIKEKQQGISVETKAVCKDCGHVYSFKVTIPPSEDSCPKCGSTNYICITNSKKQSTVEGDNIG